MYFFERGCSHLPVQTDPLSSFLYSNLWPPHCSTNFTSRHRQWSPCPPFSTTGREWVTTWYTGVNGNHHFFHEDKLQVVAQFQWNISNFLLCVHVHIRSPCSLSLRFLSWQQPCLTFKWWCPLEDHWVEPLSPSCPWAVSICSCFIP